jgi:hypothetical protein
MKTVAWFRCKLRSRVESHCCALRILACAGSRKGYFRSSCQGVLRWHANFGNGALGAGLESGRLWNKMLATRVVRLGTAFVRTFKVNAPVGNRGANIVTVMTERSRTEKADGA